MALSSVVLPAPLGPMIARISPGAMARLTGLTATRAPNRTLTPSTSSSGRAGAGWLTAPPVHPLHYTLDQLVDFRLLGQVGVARVGDVPALRPVPDRRQIDVDERGHPGPRLADAHDLPDVGGELELVLEKLRREQRAVGQAAHVPGPVDDLQVSVLAEEAGV